MVVAGGVQGCDATGDGAAGGPGRGSKHVPLIRIGDGHRNLGAQRPFGPKP